MKRRRTWILPILLLTLACNLPGTAQLALTPTVSVTLGQAAPTVAAPEPMPSATATGDAAATQPPEATGEATATAEATAEATATTQPTRSGAPAAVITAGNAAALVSSPLPLGGLRGRILWASPDVLKEQLDPHPDVLLFQEAALHPILVDPVGLAQPVALPLNGGSVLDFAPNASSLVVQFDSGTAVVRPEGPQVWAVTQPAAPYGAAYSRDGSVLALTSGDVWAVTLLRVQNGTLLARLTGFETAAPVYSVFPGPQGQAVAWVARGTLQLQETGTSRLSPAVQYEEFISTLSFSPDGRSLYVVAGSRFDKVSVPSGQVTNTLALTQPLTALDVSRDNTLVAGGYGSSLLIWDANTLAPLASYATSAQVLQVSFSPDGRYLAAIDDGGIFWVWRTP